MAPSKATSRLDTVSPQDAEILTWFFGEGLCEFERSIHGSLMSRVTNGGHVECPTCRGKRWVKLRVAECGDCKDGFVYPEAAKAPRGDVEVGRAFQTVATEPYACPTCRVGDERRGRRVVLLEPTSRKEGFTVPELCGTCLGLGVVGTDGHAMERSLPQYRYEDGGLVANPIDQIPAFPSGAEVRDPPPEPDDRALRWYGLVARRMSHMRKRDVEVLYAVYGIGIQWEKQVRDSRERERESGKLLKDGAWPVQVLTALGKKTLARFDKQRPKELPGKEEKHYPQWDFIKTWKELNGPERLLELVFMPEKQIDHRVWEGMKDQAAEMIRRAIRAWNIAALRSGTTAGAARAFEQTKKRRKPKPKVDRLEPARIRLMGLRKRMEIEVAYV
jgi:hypothetical protein